MSAVGESRVATYVITPATSRLSIRTVTGGMLSALGHNPTFAVRDFTGEVNFDPDAPDTASVSITIRAEGLVLMDDVSEKDRREIERIMRGDVLDVTRYPDIVYSCRSAVVSATSPGQFNVSLPGELTLHGVTQPHELRCKATVTGDLLRAFGDFSLRQSEFGIKPVNLAGMIKIKDELKGSFDIVARR